MVNRRQSLTILILYFIVYALPSVFVTVLPKLGSQVFILQTVDYLVGAVLLVGVATRMHDPNPLEKHRSPWATTILWGLLGTVLVIAGQSVILEITQLLGRSTASANTTTLLTVGKQYPFFFLAVMVGAPIMEELVFRKVIFGNLTPITGQLGAALISSVFFSFAHADGHFVLYAFIGLLFCWLYRQTGRIQTSMIAHVLMNTAVIIPTLLGKY